MLDYINQDEGCSIPGAVELLPKDSKSFNQSIGEIGNFSSQQTKEDIAGLVWNDSITPLLNRTTITNVSLSLTEADKLSIAETVVNLTSELNETFEYFYNRTNFVMANVTITMSNGVVMEEVYSYDNTSYLVNMTSRRIG